MLRSQITSLQTALAEAREENAERKEHEAEWASQFQVGSAVLFLYTLSTYKNNQDKQLLLYIDPE